MSNSTVFPVGSVLRGGKSAHFKAKLSILLPAVLVVIFYIPRYKLEDTSD